ncbi:MAG: PhoH family protein [Fervidicoccaceae archaeon]
MGVLGDKVKPLTEGQTKLVEALRDREVELVGVFGPTGTGKSLLTVAYGYDALREGQYRRFVVARPVVDVETGRELLASELGDAYGEVMMRYLEDLASAYIERSELEGLISSGRIQFADTHLLRGRSFDESLVFLDDAQHVPTESLLEIISRMGRGSKLVIAGDPVFQSREVAQQVQVARELLVGEEKARVVDLGLSDIVRPGARRAARLLLELRMRSRQLSEDERRVVESMRIHAPDAEVVTVLDARELAKRFSLQEGASAFFVVVKAGHYGRAIGKKGERIAKVEEELGQKVRIAEATLNMGQLLRSIHPLPRALSAARRIDLEGNAVVIHVPEGKAGPIIGQKGVFIRFTDAVLWRLMGTRVIVRQEGGQS